MLLTFTYSWHWYGYFWSFSNSLTMFINPVWNSIYVLPIAVSSSQHSLTVETPPAISICLLWIFTTTFFRYIKQWETVFIQYINSNDSRHFRCAKAFFLSSPVHPSLYHSIMMDGQFAYVESHFPHKWWPHTFLPKRDVLEKSVPTHFLANK